MSEILEKLKKIDIQNTSSDEIYDMLSKIDTYPMLARTLKKGEIIVRTRPNETDEIFDNKSKLSYPPNGATEYGRANVKDAKSFYGSLIGEDFNSYAKNYGSVISAIVPTIAEQKFFKLSQKQGIFKVTYGVWIVKEEFPVAVLVQNSNYKGKLKYIDQMIEMFNKHLSTLDAKNVDHATEVTKFLCEQFEKRVEIGEEDNYKITANFTKRIYEKDISGLIYPSTPMEGGGLNIVLQPVIADNYLELVEAGECTVYKYNSDHMIAPDTRTSNIDREGNFSFDKKGWGYGHLGALNKYGAKNYYELLSNEINKNNPAAINVKEKYLNDEITKGDFSEEFFQRVLDHYNIEEIKRN